MSHKKDARLIWVNCIPHLCVCTLFNSLSPLVSFSDNFCKHFGPRSGQTKRSWSGSKLFDILNFLKVFLENLFWKISRQSSKTPGGIELSKQRNFPIWLPFCKGSSYYTLSIHAISTREWHLFYKQIKLVIHYISWYSLNLFFTPHQVTLICFQVISDPRFSFFKQL